MGPLLVCEFNCKANHEFDCKSFGHFDNQFDQQFNRLTLRCGLAYPPLGCFKISTYDRINSASNSFRSRYHAIFKYLNFFAVRQV